MIQFVRLERGVKIRSFRKNIQSSSAKTRSPVMPDEMEERVMVTI